MKSIQSHILWMALMMDTMVASRAIDLGSRDMSHAKLAKQLRQLAKRIETAPLVAQQDGEFMSVMDLAYEVCLIGFRLMCRAAAAQGNPWGKDSSLTTST